MFAILLILHIDVGKAEQLLTRTLRILLEIRYNWFLNTSIGVAINNFSELPGFRSTPHHACMIFVNKEAYTLSKIDCALHRAFHLYFHLFWTIVYYSR